MSKGKSPVTEAPTVRYTYPMPTTSNPPKIAIVHDWLTNMGGAERVVLAMHEAFPDAPIYTSVYEPEHMPLFKGLDVRTTWLQNLPGPLRKLHKFFPVLRVWAFRALDLSDYDIMLSSSSAEAKQVRKTRQDQVHLCYCHTPIRYYWSHYHEYKQNPGFGAFNPLVRLAMPLIVPYMKKRDFAAAQDVDVFIANSSEVQARIRTYYKKPSTIIHPPVDIERFTPAPERDDYYVAMCRQVPYKRVDLVVQAAKALDVPLKVFGNGSEHNHLMQLAGPRTEFFTDRFGDASDEAVARALNAAKGFIYPAEEDFGIVQVEALAAGAPVITYGRGGSRDIVQDGVNGVLFDDQTVAAVVAAIERAEATRFDHQAIARTAKRFAKTLFISKLRKVVSDQHR